MGIDADDGINRRLRDRIDLDSMVMVRIGDAVADATCVNAGMGGMLLVILPQGEIDFPMELVGRHGDLYFEQRSGDQKLVIESSFEVVRVEARTSESHPFQMAVRFVDLDTANSLELLRLIRWNSWE